MPLLGKRKYINKKIEDMINRLDIMGYDTTEIKKVYYDIEDEEDENDYTGYDNEYYNSAGALLPYRSRINKTLDLIEEMIGQSYYDEQPNYYDAPQINQQDYQGFKNNVINTVKQNNQPANNQQRSNQINNVPTINNVPPTNQTKSNFDLF